MGFYDRDHFNDTDSSSNCACGLGFEPGACGDCRNRFVWIDGTPLSDFAPWHNSEPDLGERCVRLAKGNNDEVLWRGISCSEQLDYVCSRGNINETICISFLF